MFKTINVLFACSVVFVMLTSGCQDPTPVEYRPMLEQRLRKLTSIAEPNATESRIEKGETTLLPAGPLDLRQAIDIALTYNPGLKATLQDVGIAEQQIQIARSAFLPQISGRYGHDFLDRDLEISLPGGLKSTLLEREFQRAELDLKWMLWDFGRSLGRYRQAKFGREIASTNYRRLRHSVIYQTTEAYFSVLRAQKAKDIAIDALYSAKSQLETAENLFSQEIVAKDNVLRAKVQVAEFKQQLIAAENAIRLTMNVLNRIMGVNVNRPTKIVDLTQKPEFNVTIDWALQQAINHRPEFEQVQLGIRLRQEELTTAQAEFLPEIFVANKLTHIEDTGELNKNVAFTGVGIQINLYSGGRRSAQVHQARREIAKAIEVAKSICDTIALEVRQAFLAIEDAKARLDVAETTISLAVENRRLVLEKYKNTIATPTDVADAEAAHTRAQQNYYTALYDHIFSVEQLQFAMGTNDISRPGFNDRNGDESQLELKTKILK